MHGKKTKSVWFRVDCILKESLQYFHTTSGSPPGVRHNRSEGICTCVVGYVYSGDDILHQEICVIPILRKPTKANLNKHCWKEERWWHWLTKKHIVGTLSASTAFMIRSFLLLFFPDCPFMIFPLSTMSLMSKSL